MDPLRGGSRTAATSKMERFVIIVNGWKPLTITIKCSILDVVAVLDPPLPLQQCVSTVGISVHCWYQTLISVCPTDLRRRSK